jgi:(2Fe-2S) ferredoxin
MPRPLKQVFVCSQNRPPNHPRGACTHQGANEVLQTFWLELQTRNCYEQVTVTYCGCLGPCDKGPNVVVYPEGVMYSGVKKEDVGEIFEKHLLGGTPVERLKLAGW